jgi:NTP pyrophosphatase (non-canonical NTP hydrolase)
MLTFDEFRQKNVARCEDIFHPLNDWSASDWGVAMSGETGEMSDELAIVILGLHTIGKSGKVANAVKKFNRRDDATDIHLKAIENELADMIIYADLLAARLGINLEDAIRSKFNEVSEKRKSKVML